MTPSATPRLLAMFGEALSTAGSEGSGALWALGESGRQLDANLVRLPAGASVPEHQENDLDVLLLVVDGAGHVDGGEDRVALTPGALLWLPRGSRRAVHAGPDGVAYLTVHRRRAGMTIGRRPSAAVEEGGEAACLLNRVCPECGRLSGERDARYCGRCGTPLDS